MPELPEVESVVQALAPNLTGRSIKSVEVLARTSAAGSPRPLKDLVGRRFERFTRRGKFIIADLSEDFRLAVHLRMTGWLGVRTRQDLNENREPYARVVLGLEGGRDLLVFRDIRKFGRMWCGSRERIDALKALAKLGPDPLEVSAGEFTARLRARRGRLKSLLLDQTFLAGLGNIYADEALFRARLHPLRAAARVRPEAAERLYRAIQAVLRGALAAGGSSIDDYLHPDGTPGWFQRELKAYGREGEPCENCGRPIRRTVVGQRGTWFCAGCQRA